MNMVDSFYFSPSRRKTQASRGSSECAFGFNSNITVHNSISSLARRAPNAASSPAPLLARYSLEEMKLLIVTDQSLASWGKWV